MKTSIIAYYLEKAKYWEDDSQWNLEWHLTPEGRAWRQENADYYKQQARSAAIRAGYAVTPATTDSSNAVAGNGVSL